MKIIFKLLRILIVLALVTGCAEKYELDRKMEELCKKDGGVKIYETVKLPPEMFDKDGYPFPGWRNRLNKEDRLSEDYLYIHERKVLKDGDIFKGEGRLTRIDLKIIRKVDNKILAEHITYLRAGGDGFVIGHPTGNSCSFSTDSIMEKVNGALEKLVFTKN